MRKTQRWIGRRGSAAEFPPRSLNLTPPDFYLWGALKDTVYATKPQTLEELRVQIEHACNDIPLATIQLICHSVLRRCWECTVAKEIHFEHAVIKITGLSYTSFIGLSLLRAAGIHYPRTRHSDHKIRKKLTPVRFPNSSHSCHYWSYRTYRDLKRVSAFVSEKLPINQGVQSELENVYVRKNSPQYMFRNSSHSCHYQRYRTYRLYSKYAAELCFSVTDIFSSSCSSSCSRIPPYCTVAQVYVILMYLPLRFGER
ncbi:hypothetical protein ANN_11771 [Periplaneta americana]|uniref:Uncharacterized protein n=1 Tax=Periplaneta americana TaxID=6978 RepID=A0ABQ8T603_PERAM|nr:hypothetical protein ANN_11771 [Periplaneta americana]